MFNKSILNTEVQDFIRNFEGEISKLAFSGSPFETVSIQELLQQIESRRRIEKKLPTWFSTRDILYPPKLNLEQTSSEITSEYKASLVKGELIADITGGFGVDSYYFSEKFPEVHHFELNESLSEIVRHNFQVLGRNIKCFNEDGLKAVLNKKYPVIYADPSRRHDSKGKVFFLKDCQPNIPDNIDEILSNCEVFLLKTSPMLDITVGLNELKDVSEIHIVAVENEVKELLWLLKKGNDSELKIKTINFTKTELEEFSFNWNETANADYSLPQEYLYEPNAAILKSGAFDLISEKLNLNKIEVNTHLYTNDHLIDFPGRRFKIEKVVPYNKKEIKSALAFKKANITTRNFPESVANLRKKWKLSDGGNIYLFFTTNMEGKRVMIVCSKVWDKIF
ncbi:class I SAM-dependent methyltransferase [Aequorivita sp. KMM 9714]|uniref:THUMP-like domain-containing protein n=1 Tax=Aequorivita sp. KMM 9714 TaxID=2707173 RepID=UPI0013ED897E|nr:class I SAM-dependent methyltransferase [Aequorivita sp. KMM 9714]NGX83971.1 class I SAM-dependent methyltransferase [Aequorivita sp. KMM 9714]